MSVCHQQYCDKSLSLSLAITQSPSLYLTPKYNFENSSLAVNKWELKYIKYVFLSNQVLVSCVMTVKLFVHFFFINVVFL